MEQLHAQYDDLQSRIDDMHNIIQNSIAEETNIWLQNTQQDTSEQPNPSLQVLVERLEECCRDLDIVL
jgi:hypothetical protein